MQFRWLLEQRRAAKKQVNSIATGLHNVLPHDKSYFMPCASKVKTITADEEQPSGSMSSRFTERAALPAENAKDTL